MPEAFGRMHLNEINKNIGATSASYIKPKAVVAWKKPGGRNWFVLRCGKELDIKGKSPNLRTSSYPRNHNKDNINILLLLSIMLWGDGTALRSVLHHHTMGC